MATLRLLGALTCFVLAIPVWADDLKKVNRTIAEEPVYESKAPKYCLVLIGPEAKTRIWLVLDGDILYVDRNSNGDLTEADEKIRPSPERVNIVPGPNPPKQLQYRCSLGKLGDIKVLSINNDYVYVDIFDAVRSLRFSAGGDDQGSLEFAERPKDAPIVNCGALVMLPRYRLMSNPRVREVCRILLPGHQRDRMGDLDVSIGSEGLGAGTCAAIRVEDVPKDKHPIAEIEFPRKHKSGEINRFVLKHRS